MWNSRGYKKSITLRQRTWDGGQSCALYNTSDGELSGYAWSDNIGWVTFNKDELSGCPRSPCKAKVSSSDGKMSGWARALSADSNGWDGWISLSGTSPPDYGPVLNTTNPNKRVFEGYAWGSDVIGWLKFDPWTGYETKLSVCNSNNFCEAGLGENTATCPRDCVTASFDLAKTGDLFISTASPGSQTSNSTTLSVSPYGGMKNPIALTLDSVRKPNGQTFTPDSLGIGAIFSDNNLEYEKGSYQTGTFKVSVLASLPSGNYTLVVLGSGGAVQRTIDVGLSVNRFSPKFEEF